MNNVIRWYNCPIQGVADEREDEIKLIYKYGKTSLFATPGLIGNKGHKSQMGHMACPGMVFSNY